MKIERIPFTGWLAFAVTYFALHLVLVVISIVFFGAHGKSTRSADFVIFRVLLGFLLTLGGTLGYAVVSLVFSFFGRMSSRVELVSATLAALAAYAVSQMAAWTPLREALEKFSIQIVGDIFNIAVPVSFLAAASGVFVLSAATMIAALFLRTKSGHRESNQSGA